MNPTTVSTEEVIEIADYLWTAAQRGNWKAFHATTDAIDKETLRGVLLSMVLDRLPSEFGDGSDD